jgi:hypothetical protein
MAVGVLTVRVDCACTATAVNERQIPDPQRVETSWSSACSPSTRHAWRRWIRLGGRVRDMADRSVGADSLQFEFIDRRGLDPGFILPGSSRLGAAQLPALRAGTRRLS